MPHPSKTNNSSRVSHRRKRTQRQRGKQNEILPGDSKSFTILTGMPKTMSKSESNTYTVCQEFDYGTIGAAWLTTSTSTPTFASFAPSLQNIDQYSTFVALFDQYRISQIEFWLVPFASAASSSNFATGFISSVIDLDDSTSISTVQAGDYASCLTTNVDQGHYRRFIPHVADALYSGSFSSYGNVAAPWIDTSSPSVIHYGVKVAAGATTAIMTYGYRARAVIQFRSVR